MYPTELPLDSLLSESAEYSSLKSDLEKIRLLSTGGWELRNYLRKFLSPRPGEEDAVYESRLEKFAYSNVLGSAIAQLSSKITNGSVHLSLADARLDDFWLRFREDNDGNGRTEIQLLEQVFSESLKYRTVFAHIDKPSAIVAPRNRAEEEALGLRPKIIVYPGIQVPLYKESDGVLQWLKVFQILDYPTPFAGSLKLARWTFIDTTYIARYESFVKLNYDGQILELLNENGDPLPISETPKVPRSSLVEHGFGFTPVVVLRLPMEKWGANQAYGLAEQCLRLECHRYDLLTSAYLQRTYKPIKTPDSDLDKLRYSPVSRQKKSELKK